MAEKKKSKAEKKRSLTDRQQLFCDEYLVDCNATQAAVRAGYSKRTAAAIGAENLQKPHIRAYIDKRMDEKKSKLIASQDEVLMHLTAVLRGKTQAVEIVVEGTGKGFSEARTVLKEPSEMEKLKAAEQLSKCYGMHTDKEKLALERRKLEIEEERLELERARADASTPDNEIKVVIGGYEESWSE